MSRKDRNYRFVNFKMKLHEKHKGKVKLCNNQEYINIKTRLLFICNKNHKWMAEPRKILEGSACPHCYNENKFLYSIEDIILLVKNRNEKTPNKKVKLIDTIFRGKHKKHEFQCEYGHKWFTRITNILNQHSGCPECYGNKIHTTKTFLAALKDKNILDIKLLNGEQYINNSTKLRFVCKHNHVWNAAPTDILSGYGCPYCVKKPYSKKACKWMNYIMEKYNIDIQHAENGGEYSIAGTRYKADGYCHETNTIYEFHGDAFHGNPRKFKTSEHCHPFDYTITAGELYERTLKKEKFILSIGYNLITMWEMDF